MFYFLYLMLDLFSRYVVGWMLTNEESSHYAKHFIRTCMRRTQEQTNIRQLTIHSDRGAPMTANGTRQLLDILGIRQSFSRPRVSNDNPFSEAQFRTLKYHPTYPRFFEGEPAAKQWLERFIKYYNYEAPHSGLAGFTPAQVYHDEVEALIQKRQAALEAAFDEHPERFSKGRPLAKRPPAVAGINMHYFEDPKS